MVVSSKRKLTYEEYLAAFPSSNEFRTELIDGEVWVAAEPTVRHQRIAMRLLVDFSLYLREHPGGEILPPVNVCLDVDQGFGPDLVYVHEWGDDPLTYHGPPPFVVEVVSDARRDLRIKRDRYERYGVAEYWAVLPEADQIQVFRLDEGRYGPPQVYEPPANLSPLVMPAAKIDLRKIFAD